MIHAFEKSSITAETAQRMILAAERKASELGLSMVIAVVDESGVLKALLRMDGAPLSEYSGGARQGVHRGGFRAADGPVARVHQE